MSLLPRADVPLMTVSEAETRAVLDAMAEVTGQKPQSVPRGDRTLYDLGSVAKTRVWLARSEQGATTPGGAFATLSTALPELRPLAVLLVGAATGIDPEAQRLGDILVSKQLMAYEPQRFSTGPDGRLVEIARGDRVSASELAVDRCRTAALAWRVAPVRFGLLLSGEKQIEHRSFAERLQAHEPEMLGVEQEGVALYVAARQRKLDWVVIKAIAAWPDGSGRQEELAARNAAAFVAHLLAQGGFAPTHEQMEALALLEEMPTDHLPTQVLPLPAISRIPFAPNPQFVGRTEELCALARQLKDNQTVAITSGVAKVGTPAVITTGIGGVGKTQLAIELAHRYGGYFKGGVFWLSCANPDSIAGEVAACGLGGLIARPDYASLKQAEQVALVQAAWQEPIPRLLIFDNCEDEALLRKWQPKTGGCRVLVTSRRPIWSAVLKVQTLPLDVLPRADSIRLLTQLAQHLSPKEANELAAELGDLPLALHLAGCYLAFYDDITPQTYLTKLRAINPLTHWSLQGDGVEVMPTDREPHVARAFALSFGRLDSAQPTDALAQALLARAACFAPGESFERAWLGAAVEVSGDEEQQLRACTGGIKRLLGLGLLEQVDAERLRLHRLLMAYTALALNDAEALPAVERVVDALAVQANKANKPQAMQAVLPHLRYLVQRADGREDVMAARLHSGLAGHFSMVGAYRKALLLSKRALTIFEQVLGANHLDTAMSLNNLAELYREQEAFEEARPLCERALAIFERVLGPEHPDTAMSLNNLALLLKGQGAFEEARPLFERTLAISERALGDEHPQTASSLNNLAALLDDLGAFEEARPLYKRALAIREQVLGVEHPDTAISLNNLALLLEKQGALKEARPLYERALAISERVLGDDHPLMATCLNNLAGLLQDQKAFAEARLLYERALAIRERVLGDNHPDTARSLNNLAVFHADQGDFANALPLQARALEILQVQLGPHHPTTMQTQQSLATLHQRMTIAALPEAMRVAMEAKDQGAFQQALQTLPPKERKAVVAQMRQVAGVHDLLERFLPLLQGITTVAQGDDTSRPKVEVALAKLEQHGYCLTAAAQAIWAGQRDPAVLTAGLDDTDTALVQQVLTLLAETEKAGRCPQRSVRQNNGAGSNTSLITRFLDSATRAWRRLRGQ